MRHELLQIENDLEALVWAGGCLIAGYIERGRALTRRQTKIGLAWLLAVAIGGAATWWAGQRPYLTPGNHQVFREGSEVGALAGFFVFIAAAPAGVFSLLLWINDHKLHQAGRAGRVCFTIAAPYMAALTLVSLLTPATVVNIGDSYCMDMWCLGVNHVNATRNGQEILYTAEVAISVDSRHPHHFPAEQAKGLFYAVVDQGRRYPLLPEELFLGVDATAHPANR